MAKSLDVLDRVIGEFDDGFLSESDARSISSATRRDSKGQFSFNDKIDKIFDEVYEDSKVERLNNFKISSSEDKKHNNLRSENVKSDNPSEIPAPGTFLAARRQYLDHLDRHSNDGKDKPARGSDDGGRVTKGGIKSREKFSSSKEAVVPSPPAAAVPGRTCQSF